MFLSDILNSNQAVLRLPILLPSPVALSAPDIAYTKEDDDVIDEYHRKTGKSCNHSYSNAILKFTTQSRRHGILYVYSSTAGSHDPLTF